MDWRERLLRPCLVHGTKESLSPQTWALLAASLAASIGTDSTSVGQPAVEGVQVSSNHHSFLIFVFFWGG